MNYRNESEGAGPLKFSARIRDVTSSRGKDVRLRPLGPELKFAKTQMGKRLTAAVWQLKLTYLLKTLNASAKFNAAQTRMNARALFTTLIGWDIYG